MLPSVRTTKSGGSSSSSLVDFLRHLHEHAAPVLSWHATTSRSDESLELHADRFHAPLKKIIHVANEMVVETPRDLTNFADISRMHAEQFFNESRALHDYLTDCAVVASSCGVLLKQSNSYHDSHRGTVSFAYRITPADGANFGFKVSELERNHRAMLDAQDWGNSVAKILSAWSIGILKSRRLISVSGTDRNRTCHCIVKVLPPSPLRPFVPGLQIRCSSEKARNIVLRELHAREIEAEASEDCRDIFRRVGDSDTEITITAARDPKLKRLLADWCLK